MLMKWQIQRLLHQVRHSIAAPSRNPRTAVVFGRLLAIAFLICFATGLYSHFLQDPLPGMVFLTRPFWLYQVTQGLHITAGIVCFPLLFAKLYAIFPNLFQSPPVRSFPHFLERASIAVFVSASLVQITIGLLNTYQWYALFAFSFRQTHYALSFVIIGSLAVHIAIKLPIIARYWKKSDAATAEEGAVDLEAKLDTPDELQRLTGRRQNAGVSGRIFEWIDKTPESRPQVSRRGFVATVVVASAALVTLTAGQSFRVLDGVNVFGARKNDVGPQGLPINRTAKQAKIEKADTGPGGWVLTVSRGDASKSFTYAELRAMPQHEVVLPIACVEGWSQYAKWKGPRVKDLIAAVDATADSTVRVTSLEKGSIYARSTLQPEFVRNDLTLIALELEGEPLALDHGFPARLIAPARSGVLQTKWLSTVEVMS